MTIRDAGGAGFICISTSLYADSKITLEILFSIFGQQGDFDFEVFHTATLITTGGFFIVVVVEVLLYVHRNRRLIRDGSPGRPPRLSHSS